MSMTSIGSFSFVMHGVSRHAGTLMSLIRKIEYTVERFSALPVAQFMAEL